MGKSSKQARTAKALLLTLIDAMIPGVCQKLLGAHDGDGALGGHDPGNLKRLADGQLLSAEDVTHKADAKGLVGAEDAGGQTHIADPAAAADDLGEAGKRADVRGQTNVNFLD